MRDEVLIFGHKNPDTDSICSSIGHAILDKKKGWETKARRIGKVNKETQYVLDYLKMEAPELIEKVEEGQEVILVDHNEFSQSVDGIEKAKIIAVTDHHPIAGFRTSEAIYYTAKPYGCTATILYEEFKRLHHEIEEKEAVLMASAIISDTLLLKSPTTTKQDEIALKELANIAKIDIQKYGLEMLKAGTNLDNFSAKELINIDAKEFEKEGIKFEIAQVNTVSIENVLAREKEIKEEIQKNIQEKGLSLFVFAVTDILNSNSEIIALGERTNVIKEAFGKELKEDKIFLEGVVSRKKQILPDIDRNI